MNRRTLIVLLVATGAAGAAVRIWAAITTAFWFDEIWSQEIGTSTSIGGIFGLRHDTNHILHTVWCHFVGDYEGWFLYRLPALVCGCATVFLIGWMASRRNAASGVFTTIVAAGSFLMCHYSAEARGYGPVVFLSLLAVIFTGRFLDKPTWQRAMPYWVCSTLGLLFHYTYFFPALACGVWTVWRLWEQSHDSKKVLLDGALLHAVPAITVGLVYFLIIRDMVIGGGPRFPGIDVLCDLVVSAFAGGRAGSLFNGVVLTGALAILAVECVFRWREKASTRSLYPALLLLAPAVTLGILRPDIIYVRYFLVTVPFMMLLFGSFLGRCWGWGLGGRIAAVALVSFSVASNAPHIRSLLGDGKGRYLEAMEFMAEHSTTRDIHVTFAWDSADLNGKLLAWYSRFLPEGRSLIIDVDPRAEEYMWSMNGPSLRAGPNKLVANTGAGAEWFVGFHWTHGFIAPPELRDGPNQIFVLARTFPFDSIAGWNWYIYRRQVR